MKKRINKVKWEKITDGSRSAAAGAIQVRAAGEGAGKEGGGAGGERKIERAAEGEEKEQDV